MLQSELSLSYTLSCLLNYSNLCHNSATGAGYKPLMLANIQTAESVLKQDTKSVPPSPSDSPSKVWGKVERVGDVKNEFPCGLCKISHYETIRHIKNTCATTQIDNGPIVSLKDKSIWMLHKIKEEPLNLSSQQFCRTPPSHPHIVKQENSGQNQVTLCEIVNSKTIRLHICGHQSHCHVEAAG